MIDLLGALLIALLSLHQTYPSRTLPRKVPHHMNVILLDTFRLQYSALEARVSSTIATSSGDTVLLQKLGDNLDEYYKNVTQVCLSYIRLHT